jgi:hypothetical protein
MSNGSPGYVTDAPSAMAHKQHCPSPHLLRYHAIKMFSQLHSRLRGRKLEELPEVLAATAAAAIADSISKVEESVEETTILRTIGWLTAGLGAVAIGLFVGRELRQRYKFNRRTPYDFYAHSGDEVQDMEFGVGI